MTGLSPIRPAQAGGRRPAIRALTSTAFHHLNKQEASR